RDRLSPDGDGLGPVFNARSCVACHNQARPGGGGGVEHNVTTYVIVPPDDKGELREGVIHSQATAPRYRETLALLDPSLPAISQPTLKQLGVRSDTRATMPGEGLELPGHIRLSQRNTPALFGARLIDDIPD